MKAENTIKRRVRVLRAFIQHPDSDPVAVRVAQSMEYALRWATEDVRGWPDVITEARETADLIRSEWPKP